MRPLRVLFALLLAAAPVPPVAAAPALEPGVTVVAVGVADDEAGASDVRVTCTAVADDAARAVATWVECSTTYSSDTVGLPGPVAAATLRVTEPTPVIVCVGGGARYPERVVTAPTTCGPVTVTVSNVGDGCRAFARPPTAPHAFGVTAIGGFACAAAAPAYDALLTVCLEVLDPEGWLGENCSTYEDGGPATYAETAANGCRYGLWLVRTSTRFHDRAGRVDHVTSEPVGYLCTPLT